MMTNSEDGITQMSKLGGGGGAVAKTNKALIVATFEKEVNMSNGLVQNIGDVGIGVERVAKFLKVAGF